MKNKMVDVRDHLVAMMEELGDKSADGQVIERAKATANVAGMYIAAVKTELDAIKLYDDTGRIASVIEAPPMDRQDGNVLSIGGRRSA
ncbi:MAG: hypothetical protein ACOH2M_33295 [Cypionkella sp.]